MEFSIINGLAHNIISRDFNVQTESIEVLEALLLPKDPKAVEGWTKFMNEHSTQILKMFADLQKQALPDEEDDESDSNEDSPDLPNDEMKKGQSNYINFIALTQSMKLEYEMLNTYEVLLEEFTNSREHLMQTMDNLNTEHESITYEAILLLS